MAKSPYTKLLEARLRKMRSSGGTAASILAGGKSDKPFDLQEELKKLQQRKQTIWQLEPRLGGRAEAAVSPVRTFASGILHALDLPRRGIYAALGWPTDPSQMSAVAGQVFNIKGEGGLAKFDRGVAGFSLGTALDPLSYVSLGTAGLGREAARSTIAKTLAAKAITDAGEAGSFLSKLGKGSLAQASLKELADSASARPILEKIMGKGLETASRAEQRPLLSEVLRSLTKDEINALPKHLRGGVGLAVPFMPKTRVPIVTGRITGKVSAPLGKALAGKYVGPVSKRLGMTKGLRQALYQSVTPGATARRAGLIGAIVAEEATKLSARSALASTRFLEGPYRDLQKTFKDVDKGGELITEVMEDSRGIPAAAAARGLSKEQTDALLRMRDTLDEIRNEFTDVARMKVAYRKNYVPHVPTEQALKDLKAEQVEGMLFHTTQTPRFAQARRAGAEYEKDAFKSLARFSRQAHKIIEGHRLNRVLDEAGILVQPGALGKLTGIAGIEAITQETLKKLGMPATRAGLMQLRRFAKELPDQVEKLVTPEEWQSLQVLVRRTVDEPTGKRLASLRLKTAITEGQLERAQDWGVAKIERASAKTAAKTEIVTKLSLRSPKLQEQLDKLLARKAKLTEKLAGDLTRQQRNVARLKLSNVNTAITTKVRHIRELDTRVAKAKQIVTKASTQEDAAFRKAMASVYPHTQKLSELAAEEGPTKAGLVAKRARGGKGAVTEWREPGAVATHTELKPTGKFGQLKSVQVRERAYFSHADAPPGYTKLQGTIVPGLEGKYVHPLIAEELISRFGIGSEIELAKAWDSALSTFKRWVTIPFPGFHIRNLYGGYLNNYLGGVGRRDYRLAIKILKGKATDEEVAKLLGPFGMDTVAGLNGLLTEQGIKMPNVNAILRELTGERPENVTIAGRAVLKYGGWAVEAVEDFNRTAAFIGGLRQLNGDAGAARLFTMARHGDYGELTAFERKYLKRLVPFYKWSRTNLPLQLNSILENPKKVLAQERFIRGVLGSREDERALQEHGLLPESFVRRGSIIAGPLLGPISKLSGVPGGTPAAVSLDIPLYDINKIGTSPREMALGALGELAPPIKGLVEMATRTSTYTGREARDFLPVSGPYRVVAKALERIPGLSGLVWRTTSGELRLRREATNVLNVLPTTRLVSLGGTLTDWDRLPAGVINTLTGIKGSAVDEKAQEAELYRRKARLKDVESLMFSLGGANLIEEYKAARRPKAMNPALKQLRSLQRKGLSKTALQYLRKREQLIKSRA